jgi:4a-hydroxytetrahydrobiopterin dehydratase
MKKLTDLEIQSRLKNYPDWDYYDDALHTEFEFDNFKDCMSAISRIAFECEALNHHPDWRNVYNMLYITLSTHDVDGITELDFQLLEAIEKIVEVEE